MKIKIELSKEESEKIRESADRISAEAEKGVLCWIRVAKCKHNFVERDNTRIIQFQCTRCNVVIDEHCIIYGYGNI